MNASCEHLFDVMLWSLFATCAIIVFEAVTFVFAMLPPYYECCAGLVLSGECIAGLGRQAIAIWGLVVVLTVDRSDVSVCRDLYACAWWCFVGFLVLGIALVCCSLCCSRMGLGKPPGGRAGADYGTLDARP